MNVCSLQFFCTTEAVAGLKENSNADLHDATEPALPVELPIETWIFQACFLTTAYMVLRNCEEHTSDLSSLYFYSKDLSIRVLG